MQGALPGERVVQSLDARAGALQRTHNATVERAFRDGGQYAGRTIFDREQRNEDWLVDEHIVLVFHNDAIERVTSGLREMLDMSSSVRS